MRQIYRITSLAFVVFSLTILSCKKEDSQPSADPPSSDTTQVTDTAVADLRLARIIDWEAASVDKDTVPSYTLLYNGTRVVALVGDYRDTMGFDYRLVSGAEGSFASFRSEVIRSRHFNSYEPTALDSIQFETDSFDNVQGMFIGAVEPEYNNRTQYLFQQDPLAGYDKTLLGWGQGMNTTVSLKYDSDGDPILIHTQTDFAPITVISEIEVTYSDQKNTLRNIDKNISMFDPSCRHTDIYLLGTVDKYANTFPFSIHYGRKCVATYVVRNTSYFNGTPDGHSENFHSV